MKSDSVEQVARALNGAGVPFIVVGGLAVVAHGYGRYTEDLDLVIRTGGEMRLSNFLLWQAAYAEYYSTPICWPDFGRDELYQAFAEFGQRVRRFGGLS